MVTKHQTALEKRIDAQKEKVIEFLAESGNISFACKRGGISRETYYRWKDSAVFSEKADIAIQLGKTFVNDLAHTQLIRKIQEGDMKAIRFHLVNCHDEYRPKLPERIEKKEEPITHVQIVSANCTHCRSEATDKTAQ